MQGINTRHYSDVLIIGSGAAGYAAALCLASPDISVTLISKDHLTAGSSPYAQGGIAAVMSELDSLAAHIEDTLTAGAGLCHRHVVEFTVNHAQAAIQWLINQGVQFTTQAHSTDLHLTREGGHSQRRVVHVADKTGAAVIHTLAQQAEQHPQIHRLSQQMVIDLIVEQGRCLGAWILDASKPNHCYAIYTKAVILATGGASALYRHTTNPDVASGDGMAIAWRAGCRLANLEFHQFHPTALYQPNASPFLISEALRGEGAYLYAQPKQRFMPSYDARAELAPRDIVARAIHMEMQQHGLPHVWLDLSHRAKPFIIEHFPTIYAHCLACGIDITQAPIPVVPAAHYSCGGVVTNLNAETDIQHLYAIGEVAHTGLHGANRMASNSLLECLVFAMQVSQQLQQQLPKQSLPRYTSAARFPTDLQPVSSLTNTLTSTQRDAIQDAMTQLQTLMSTHVGIVRSQTGLRQAQIALKSLTNQWQTANLLGPINKTALTLRNLLQLATLTITSALTRRESRGLHYNLDYPDVTSDSNGQDTYLQAFTRPVTITD